MQRFLYQDVGTEDGVVYCEDNFGILVLDGCGHRLDVHHLQKWVRTALQPNQS